MGYKAVGNDEWRRWQHDKLNWPKSAMWHGLFDLNDREKFTFL